MSAQPVPTMQPGVRGELSLTILEAPAAAGPIEVRLASEAVELPDNRLSRDDVVDPLARQPRLRGRFVAPAEPGTYAVSGEVLYVTCRPKWCRPRRADIAWTVTVEADPRHTMPLDQDSSGAP